MDKDPAGEDENARAVLSSWLDDFSAGKCDRADMQESFLSVCRSNSDAPWDALALLDQYQRRGKIDAALVRELKAHIAQLVFGVANQTEGGRDNTEATLDTTGSRWRKLMAERDPSSINNNSPNTEEDEEEEEENEEEFADPAAEATLMRAHQAMPLTRPPATPRPAPLAVKSKPAAAPADRGSQKQLLRDRYELISVLGRGSAGTVYRALDRHRAHLPEAARTVAVKVLNADYRSQPHELVELEREFHLAQSLSHPNIVSVFDLDRDGDTYFIVQEMLEGVLLSEVLRRLEARPMPKERALAIIGSIGAAVLHAHRRNVVHGDLKPRNVLITNGGEVKVLDFGFVRRQSLEPRVVEALQQELVMAASAPAYASIERFNGETAQPGDDVYSIACMAYELLSGQHPFGGRSALLAKAHGRHAKHITGLTHRQWHALQRALRWSREDRKIELVELLAGLGCAELQQRTFTPQELIAERAPTRPIALKITIAAALFAITLGGVLWTLRESEPPRPPQPLSEAPPPATIQDAPPATSAPAAAAAVPVAAGNAAAPASVVAFDKDTYVATESDGSVRLTIKRTGLTRSETSFRWVLKGNSAEPGEDFAAIGPNREYLAAGVESFNLTIPLVSDAITENTELFLVELQAVDGSAKLGELPRAAVIVVDDD